MTKNEKLVGDLDNIFIFYINNYKKIVWCLLCIDKLLFYRSIWVTQRTLLASLVSRLGGRHAMRDVLLPGVMPETTRLS